MLESIWVNPWHAAHQINCLNKDQKPGRRPISVPKSAGMKKCPPEKNPLNPEYIYFKSIGLMSTVVRYKNNFLGCIFWPPGANKCQKSQ